jgi:cbb3-type cytochrome oxidase cytochrome c subunit
MPAFAFLAKPALDTSLTAQRLRVLRRLGHPYSDAEIANAAGDAETQAAQIAASLRADGVQLDQVQEHSEVLALIAYLQSLGRAVREQPVASAAAKAAR